MSAKDAPIAWRSRRPVTLPADFRVTPELERALKSVGKILDIPRAYPWELRAEFIGLNTIDMERGGWVNEALEWGLRLDAAERWEAAHK